MFFMAPAMYILGIYVLAAVLPAVFLMRYIYRQDQIEPEPPGLLIGLIFSGVTAALCSIVLEMLAEGVLNLLAAGIAVKAVLYGIQVLKGDKRRRDDD